MSNPTQSVVIIAHRGASGAAPESTRAAITEAVRAGAGMVELDVQLTRDGRLVMFHDDRLERTSTGKGRLGAVTYRTLRTLDAGRWFHPRFRGERILLASQAVRLIPPPVRMNLELKRTTRRALLLRGISRLIRRERIASRVLLSSFDPALLAPLRRTRIPRALICSRHPDRSLQQAIALGCSAWHPWHALATSRRIQAAHMAGLRVHVWTVDQAAQARVLAQRGVDGIFTNQPRRLGSLRASP